LHKDRVIVLAGLISLQRRIAFNIRVSGADIVSPAVKRAHDLFALQRSFA